MYDVTLMDFFMWRLRRMWRFWRCNESVWMYIITSTLLVYNIAWVFAKFRLDFIQSDWKKRWCWLKNRNCCEGWSKVVAEKSWQLIWRNLMKCWVGRYRRFPPAPSCSSCRPMMRPISKRIRYLTNSTRHVETQLFISFSISHFERSFLAALGRNQGRHESQYSLQLKVRGSSRKEERKVRTDLPHHLLKRRWRGVFSRSAASTPIVATKDSLEIAWWDLLGSVFFWHNGPASVRLNLQIPQSSRDLNLQKVAFSSAMSVPVMSSKVAEKFVTNLTIDNEFASSSFFVTISHSSSSLMWTACSASRIWVAFDRASSILCSAASRAGSWSAAASTKGSFEGVVAAFALFAVAATNA